jgi:hypothetical protein
MFYYSVPVIWPRITALLFVPADKIIVRGAYSIIPNLGTWGESENPPCLLPSCRLK